MKTATGFLWGLAFSLSCFGGPVTFTFDNGPPNFYYGGASPPCCVGQWHASGGNPGGFVEESILWVQQANQIPLGSISTFFGNLGPGNGDPLLLFGMNDYGVTISFDYRISVTTNNLSVGSPQWSLGFAPTYGPAVGFFPELPVEPSNGAWTHFQIEMTGQNFPNLPTDNPVLAGAELAGLSTFAISAIYSVSGIGSGSVTTTMDMDNLTFGNPVPEPSSVVSLASGLALLSLRKRRFRARRS